MDDTHHALWGGATDTHWQLTASPDPSFQVPQAAVLNDGWPVAPYGPWVANTSAVRWVSPQAANGGYAAPGDYTYETTFDTTGTGIDPARLTVAGTWASDNDVVDILVNGQRTGFTTPFQDFQPHSFSISAGFVSGVNTLDFVVHNGGDSANPTGLRVEFANPLPPIAIDDSYDVPTDGSPLVVSAASGVLANDTSPSGLPLTAVLDNGPQNGSVVLNADGSYTYTPVPGFADPDSFSYHVTTADGLSSNVAIVVLNAPPPTPPTAFDDAYTLPADGSPLVVDAASGVLANDVSPGDLPLTAVVSAGAANGTVVLNSDGSFTYTPNNGYVGPDSFTYAAMAGDATSNPATVTLTVATHSSTEGLWVDSLVDAVEGSSAGYIRVRRAYTDQAVTVSYASNAAGTTAISGVDFAPLSGMLTFAAGQATADIVIDPTGAYADPAADGDEFFVADIAKPGGGTVTTPPVAIRAAPGPANRPPVFTLPAGKTRFEFALGEGAGPNVWVGQTVTMDPDRDPLTFQVLPSAMSSYFACNNAGWLRVSSTLPLSAAGTFTLRVEVDDNKGGSAQVDVLISLKPMVLLSGDFEGVKANVGTLRDTIRLDFRRLSKDYSSPLTVNYTVQWGTAAKGDLEGDAAALLNIDATHGKLTFGANETLKSITLTPKQDGVKKGMAKFTVSITQPTGANPAYATVLDDPAVELDKVKTGLIGTSKAVVTILDATRLFATKNDELPLADPAGSNGVNLNDIKQIYFPDCYLLAAIEAMAQRQPAFVKNMMQANADGTATVRYYPAVVAAAKEVEVPMTLDYGLAQAGLSGDYEVDAALGKSYEVWPYVLEAAYAVILGGRDKIGSGQGGASVDVWTCFTGQAADRQETAGKPAATIENAVRAALTANKKVVMATDWSTSLASWRKVVVMNTPIVRWHVYVVDKIDRDGLVYLYNPWGRDHVKVPVANLKDYFGSYTIQ